MCDSNMKLVILVKSIATVFLLLAFHSLYLLLKSYSIQEDYLDDIDKYRITKIAKIVILIFLFFYFVVKRKQIVCDFGVKPLYMSNFFAISLIFYSAIISPIILFGGNVSGDLIGYVALFFACFVYLPLSAVLWSILFLCVIFTNDKRCKPDFWVIILICSLMLLKLGHIEIGRV